MRVAAEGSSDQPDEDGTPREPDRPRRHWRSEKCKICTGCPRLSRHRLGLPLRVSEQRTAAPEDATGGA
jgi:hypothetical protein